MIKDWRISDTNKLWFYTPHRYPKETLNAVKFGTDYDIYHTKGGLGNWKKLKRVKNREAALRFMKSYMRKN